MDFVAGGEGVEVFRLVKVPKHGSAIFASRCAERAVRGDGNGVDVAGVANVVGLDAARSKFPDLWKDAKLAFGFSDWFLNLRSSSVYDHQFAGE